MPLFVSLIGTARLRLASLLEELHGFGSLIREDVDQTWLRMRWGISLVASYPAHQALRDLACFCLVLNSLNC